MATTVLERKLTQRELAQQWGWSMCRLTRMVNRGQIPHVRIGRDVFFEMSALEPWLAARRTGPEPVRAPDPPAAMRHSRYRD
jgi:hypothetical protein